MISVEIFCRLVMDDGELASVVYHVSNSFVGVIRLMRSIKTITIILGAYQLVIIPLPCGHRLNMNGSMVPPHSIGRFHYDRYKERILRN